MSEDKDYCEKCGENLFHKENSTECFMLQEWTRQVSALKAENERLKKLVEAACPMSGRCDELKVEVETLKNRNEVQVGLAKLYQKQRNYERDRSEKLREAED